MSDNSKALFTFKQMLREYDANTKNKIRRELEQELDEDKESEYGQSRATYYSNIPVTYAKYTNGTRLAYTNGITTANFNWEPLGQPQEAVAEVIDESVEDVEFD